MIIRAGTQIAHWDDMYTGHQLVVRNKIAQRDPPLPCRSPPPATEQSVAHLANDMLTLDARPARLPTFLATEG